MDSEVDGCIPAANVLNVENITCSRCPFPFCVVAEAGIIRYEVREHLVKAIRRLGNSMEETARTMGVSLRSVYRYTSAYEDKDCTQCNLFHSQNVVCRSNVYSVVRKNEQYIVILNKHRRATIRELKLVECFIDYVFPLSVVRRDADHHDCWTLSRIELEEEKNFERMCDALDKYMSSLSGGIECLQQTRQH